MRDICGNTKIYKNFQSSIDLMENISIAEFATEGQPTKHSESEIIALILKNFGMQFATKTKDDTCKVLSDMHGKMVKHGYGNK